MKNNATEKLLNWDAHYVGIKATKEQKLIYTTFVEVVADQIVLLSRSARITTQEVAEFTSWGASDLKGNMAYLKIPFLNKHWNC
jgi:hypothetical protein